MLLSRAINEFVAYLRDIEGKARKTYEGYEGDLQLVLRLADKNATGAFTPELVQRVLATLAERGSGPANRNRYLWAMRKFALWGLRAGHWSSDPTAALKRLRIPKRQPRAFTREEYAALMQLELPADQVVIRALLAYTGLRASTIADLKAGDLDFTPRVLSFSEGRQVPVGGTIRSRGKGGGEVTSYMQPQLKAVLFEHVQRKALGPRSFLIARDTMAVIGQETIIAPKPYDQHSLWELCRKWGRRAGVPHCHPHRWRHTFGMELRRKGLPLDAIQQLMGHASISATQIYAQPESAELAAGAMLLTPFWEEAPKKTREQEIADLKARLAELEGQG